MTVQPTPIPPRTGLDAPGEFPAAEPVETLRDYYRQMALIREFELRAAQMYQRAKIGGYCHLNLGEEATVVGLMAALQPRDYLFATYRDHGYALARGLEPGRVMAELFGKAAGVSGGRGALDASVQPHAGPTRGIRHRRRPDPAGNRCGACTHLPRKPRSRRGGGDVCPW